MAEDIAYIESIYPQFVEEANFKIKSFFEGKYDSFDEDTRDQAWVKRDFVQKNLGELRKLYAFVRTVDEIQHLKFIEEIRKKAEKYHFKMHTPLIQAYGTKEILALDLALHFPLWGGETYDNHDFQVIGFSREKKMETYAHFEQVGVVPILKITVDENGNLENVVPYDFKTMSFGLHTIFLEE